MARVGSFIFNIEILWAFKMVFTRINLMFRRVGVYSSNKYVSMGNPTNVKKWKMCTQGRYHSGRGTAKNAFSVAHRAQLPASHPEQRAAMAQIIKLPMVPNRRAFAAFGLATKSRQEQSPRRPQTEFPRLEDRCVRRRPATIANCLGDAYLRQATAFPSDKAHCLAIRTRISAR
jgi:hypothetical protein